MIDETLKDGVEQILMEEVPGVLEVQNISSTLQYKCLAFIESL